MPTNRTRRSRNVVKTSIPDSLFQYLTTGNYLTRETCPNCPGRVQTFRLAHPGRRAELKEVWLLHRDAILREWKRQKKTGLPWAAKLFDASK